MKRIEFSESISRFRKMTSGHTIKVLGMKQQTHLGANTVEYFIYTDHNGHETDPDSCGVKCPDSRPDTDAKL